MEWIGHFRVAFVEKEKTAKGTLPLALDQSLEENLGRVLSHVVPVC